MTPTEVLAEVRQVAAARGFPDVDLLLATVWQESGGRPEAVGDRGHSVGIFQEHDQGRGHGLSVAQRQDVRAATNRAIDEFVAVRRRNPDVSRGQWAALAQRPADASGYAARVNRLLSGRDGAFGAAVGGLTAPSANGPSAPATGAVGPGSVAAADAPDWLQQSWAAGGTFGKAAGAAAAVARQAAPGVAAAAGASAAIWPVAGQRVGAVNNPFGGQQARSAGATVPLPSSNVGADLTGAYGAEVVAPVSGTVMEVYDAPNETDRNLNHGWGGMTLLRGDDGYTYRLSHAKPGSLGVRPGQRVNAGQYLQQIGVSGNTTGPHLDWEKFDRPGHFVDPVATLGRSAGPVDRAARPASLLAGAPGADGGPWTVAAGTAPDWLQQAWAAGSTLGKRLRDAGTGATAAAGTALGGLGKVAQEAAPDWLQQAWAAGSTVGR